MPAGPDEDHDSDTEQSGRHVPSPTTDMQGDLPDDATRETGDTVDEDSTERIPSDSDGEQWRFSLDDIAETDEEEEGNVAGSLIPRGPIEPGDIDLENAFFVALGVVVIVVLVASLIFGF